jgi:peptidoglycan hydrolase CwlO-like protein
VASDVDTISKAPLSLDDFLSHIPALFNTVKDYLTDQLSHMNDDLGHLRQEVQNVQTQLSDLLETKVSGVWRFMIPHS